MNGQYRIGDVVLNNWTLVKLLGEGSYGKVYEARRKDFAGEYRSAIKIITVPHSKAEINEALSEGMTEESVSRYFRNVVEEISREFALMAQLKAHVNIVTYEDHEVIEHPDGIGWDIIIRMELLTPFTSVLKSGVLSQAEIIRFGIDMCKALEACQNCHIIHRDIKPDNIFCSPDGNYKLGDFGVARTLERTSGGLSRKGTYNYMAPEVYRDEPYGLTVDIYSLGVVMYRLLNNNRLPFLPEPPAEIRLTDREKALARRMGGEEIPYPSNDSGRLADIVLKACEYDAGHRYTNPTEMREDLESVLQRSSLEDSYSASASGRPQYSDTIIQESSDRSTPSAGSHLLSKGFQSQDLSLEQKKLKNREKSSGGIHQAGSKSGRGKHLLVVALVFVLLAGAGLFALNAGKEELYNGTLIMKKNDDVFEIQEGLPEPEPETYQIEPDMESTESQEYTEQIEIDEIHFPGEVLRKYVREQFDTDNDGSLSINERDVATEIRYFGNDEIDSLKGIEYFPNLAVLCCGFHCYLTELDVSRNTHLVELDISGSVGERQPLSVLDTSKNIELLRLRCSYSRITSLDVSNNTHLQALDCDFNKLTELDVSHNLVLENLDCSYNDTITTLNLPANSPLQRLSCSNNKLEELNLTGLSELIFLCCDHNQIKEIDISMCPDLVNTVRNGTRENFLGIHRYRVDDDNRGLWIDPKVTFLGADIINESVLSVPTETGSITSSPKPQVTPRKISQHGYAEQNNIGAEPKVSAEKARELDQTARTLFNAYCEEHQGYQWRTFFDIDGDGISEMFLREKPLRDNDEVCLCTLSPDGASLTVCTLMSKYMPIAYDAVNAGVVGEVGGSGAATYCVLTVVDRQPFAWYIGKEQIFTENNPDFRYYCYGEPAEIYQNGYVAYKSGYMPDDFGNPVANINFFENYAITEEEFEEYAAWFQACDPLVMEMIY